jgi:hypothetical protein
MLKVTCFLSYVGNRLNINASNIVKNRKNRLGSGEVTYKKGRAKEGHFFFYTHMCIQGLVISPSCPHALPYHPPSPPHALNTQQKLFSPYF